MESGFCGENSISTSPLAVTLVSKSIGLKDPANACSPVLDKRFPKVTLKVGPAEEEIVANPQFLTMGSPFFNGLVTKDNQTEPILLSDLDPAAVHLILPFLYTGYLEIRDSYVRGLLLAAIEFQIIEIQTSCLEFMTNGLNYQNYWDVRQFARDNELQSLSDKCDEFLVENFKALTECVEFLELEFPDVLRVFTLLSQTNQSPPMVRSMDILNALIMWGNYKVDDRTQHLYPLAKEINLMEVVKSHSALALRNAFMGDHSPLRNCQDCKDLYLQALESIVFEISQSTNLIIHTERVKEPDLDLIKVDEDVVVHASGHDVLSDSHGSNGTTSEGAGRAGNQAEASPIPLGQEEQESREYIVEPKPGPSTQNTTSATSNADEEGSGDEERSLSAGSEKFWPSEWLSEDEPKDSPYYPQIGDDIVYFREGHELYVKEVKEGGMYPVTNAFCKKLPWNLNPELPAEVPARVVDIKFLIKPPRLVTLKLGIVDWKNGKLTGEYINNVIFHFFEDLDDFIVLRQRYDYSLKHSWKAGDRFRCLFDTEWHLGTISATEAFNTKFPTSKFLCQNILWDLDLKGNVGGSLMSPWDIEIIPEGFGTQKSYDEGIPATETEMKSITYASNERDWRHGHRDAECLRIKTILESVMELKEAQPFLKPVDLNSYADYAHTVEYFVDLSLIKARVQNHFYRRVDAVEFDLRKICSNAEQSKALFNFDIVRQARIVRDACLLAMSQPEVTKIKKASKSVSEKNLSDSEKDDDEELNSSAPRAKRQRTLKRKPEEDIEQENDESKTKRKLNTRTMSISTTTSQVKKRK